MSALETIIGNMTLAEFARFANSSVEQIVATVLGAGPSRAAGRGSNGVAKRGPGRPPKAAGGKPGKVPRGSISDDSVIAVLKGAKGPVGAEQVRAKLGGSGAQIRAALQRLRDGGKLKVTGQRRGTRYALK